MSETQHTVTARKSYPCDSYRCEGRIEAGEDYVRAVAFPGSDHNYGPVPIMVRGCLRCSTSLIGTEFAPRMRRRRRRS
jgi:hypothetical protein